MVLSLLNGLANVFQKFKHRRRTRKKTMEWDGKEYEHLSIRYVVAITNDTEDISRRWEFSYLETAISFEEAVDIVRKKWKERKKEGMALYIDLHQAVIETDDNGEMDIFDSVNPFHVEYRGLEWPEKIKDKGFALFTIDDSGEYMGGVPSK